MSRLWFKAVSGDWQILGPADLRSALPADAFAAGAIDIVSFGHGSERGVALVAAAAANVLAGGQPVVGGLRVLEDKDEILVGCQRLYFSTESQPELTRFALAAGVRRPKCAVCRFPLEDAQLSVTCPQCGRVYHQIPAEGEQSAKPCWTYRPQCLCGHSTSLSGEPSWRPEMLEETSDACA